MNTYKPNDVIALKDTGERGRVLRTNMDGTLTVDFHEFGNSEFMSTVVRTNEIKPVEEN